MAYTYRVTWSDPDSEYVATCAEFPSLSWLDPVATDAFEGIQRLVAEAMSCPACNGEYDSDGIVTERRRARSH